MRIILLGAPGSGKSTQSQFITNRYNIPYLSTGKMLRDEIHKQSDLGKNIELLVNSGKLISDNLMITLITKYLQKKDYRNGFILDGFPRTIIQARAIQKLDIKINYVLEIQIPDMLIIDRISGRRIHPPSGREYHIKFNPPKYCNRDDFTGEPLIIRLDDHKDIIYQRLVEYHRQTKPLIYYYLQEEKYGNIHYFKINGNQEIKNINKELIKIFNK